MPDQGTKFCPRCKLEKELTTEFWYANKAHASGWGSQCKKCTREYQKEIYDRKIDDRRERSKAWYEANKDKLEVKEKRKSYKRQWKEENKEVIKAKDKEYRKRTNAKRTKYNQEYKEAHPGWSLKANQNWRKNNPEKSRRYTLARWARKKNAEGSHTADQVLLLYDLQGGYCKYCMTPLWIMGYEEDHIQPLSRDGSDYIENIALACPHCNSSKGNKTVSEWRATQVLP